MIRVSYKDLIKMQACTAGLNRFKKGRWFKTRVLNHNMGLWEIAHKERHNSEMDIWWLIHQMSIRLSEKEMTHIVEQVRVAVKSVDVDSIEWVEQDKKRFEYFERDLKVIENLARITESRRDKYGWQDHDYYKSLRNFRDHMRHLLDRILTGFWYADEPYNPMFEAIREKVYTLNLTIDWSRS